MINTVAIRDPSYHLQKILYQLQTLWLLCDTTNMLNLRGLIRARWIVLEISINQRTWEHGLMSVFIMKTILSFLQKREDFTRQEIWQTSTHLFNTAKNTVISPNFLVCTFCGKAQFPQKLCGNCAFPQNFYSRKLGEITVFFPQCKDRWKDHLVSYSSLMYGHRINTNILCKYK